MAISCRRRLRHFRLCRAGSSILGLLHHNTVLLHSNTSPPQYCASELMFPYLIPWLLGLSVTILSHTHFNTSKSQFHASILGLLHHNTVLLHLNTSPSQYCVTVLMIPYLLPWSSILLFLCHNIVHTHLNTSPLQYHYHMYINTGHSPPQNSVSSIEYLSTTIMCFFNLHYIGRPLIRLETLIVSPLLPVNGHFKNRVA